MNISMDKHWCILKYLANEIETATNEARKAKEGKKKEEVANEEDEDEDEHEFILLKDFNNMSIRLYHKDEEEGELGEELQTDEKDDGKQIPA